MRKTSIMSVLVPLVVLCTIAPALGKIIYVRPTAAGSNNGASWANAYRELNPALASASSGDEIWVAAATYKPTTGTDRTASFALRAGVAIYGGFAGTETSRGQRNWTTRVTTLSGDVGLSGTVVDNSYHVLVGASKAVLDGFTVRDGSASSNTLSFQYGGGLYCDGATSMSIVNCTFRDNSATSAGGAIYNTGNAQIILKCDFIGNSNTVIYLGGGAGIYNAGHSQWIANCTFTRNSIMSVSAPILGKGPGGAAIYNTGRSQTITNCTFSENVIDSIVSYAFTFGAAIYNTGAFQRVMHSTFEANSAKCTGIGGAIYNVGNSCLISNCSIRGNRTHAGAGVYNGGTSQTVTACTFSGNEATWDGGGGMCNSGPGQTVAHCTFTGNSAVDPSGVRGEGGGILNYTYNDSPQVVTYCTFIGNSFAYKGGGISSQDDSPVVSYCTFRDNYSTGTAAGGTSLGGGIMKAKSISNCVFTNNRAQSAGGAYLGPATQSVTDCVFSGNSATGLNGYGGAMIVTSAYFDPVKVSNCVFVGNSAKSGGAIDIYSAVTYGWTATEINNCTFTGNTASSSGGALYQNYGDSEVIANATNCLFWGNSAAQRGPDIFNDSGILNVSHSDISDWDGSHWNSNFGTDGGGNIKGNPLWVSPSVPAGPDGLWMTWDDGLRLQTASPCINAGLASAAPPKDILGNPRAAAPDIGAYEYTAPKNSADSWALYH